MNSTNDAKIRLYLSKKGYIFPETDAEIYAAEKDMENLQFDLPEKLQNPDFILKNINNPSERDWSKILLGEETEIKSLYSEEYSMAAREGGEDLPDEIKKEIEEDIKRMEEDE